MWAGVRVAGVSSKPDSTTGPARPVSPSNGPCMGVGGFDGPPVPASWGSAAERVPEPQEEGHEDQDNADVHQQPCQEVMSEEQDVGANHGRHESKHIDHGDCSSVHTSKLPARLPRAS